MNRKRSKIISIVVIFLLSSLFHFIYGWFPNLFTSLIFPINESIWEHNKIILGSFLVWAIIEKIYYKDGKNYLFSGLISATVCAIISMLVFTPIFFFILKTQDNIFVTLIIYFIAICISVFLNYKILQKDFKNYEKLAIVLWLVVFIINGILTYYPLDLPLFIDYSK